MGLELTQSLSQRMELSQSLRLSQLMDLCNLMAIPDEVLSVVVGAVAYNPDYIEKILNQNQEQNFDSAASKVGNLYASLMPSQGDANEKMSGLVITPDLRMLKGKLGDYNTQLTPDVTYVGRKDNKPELVFSDHLKGSLGVAMIQIEKSIYPKVSRLLDQIRKFDDWKRSILRDVYVMIGGVQREFFEKLNYARLNVFSQDDLAEKMNLHPSTIHRILSNRWIEVRSIDGEQGFLYAKAILPTKDQVFKFFIIPVLNKFMEREFAEKKAYSDDEIIKSAFVHGENISRRTIVKYREKSNIPNMHKRKKIYEINEDEAQFRFFF